MKRTLKKLFKKDKLNVMLVFVFIIGLSVMLYPPISSYWNSKVQSRAVASYSNAVKSLTEEEKDTMLKKADTYNEKLKDVNRPFLNYAEAGDYNSILDISGTGIMGYVTIEKLGVELPIYHGTSEGVLQVCLLYTSTNHVDFESVPYKEYDHTKLSADVKSRPEIKEDFKIVKTADKKEVIAGDTINYTITVENTGNNPIKGEASDGSVYKVTDKLPEHLVLTAEQIQAIRNQGAEYDEETRTISWAPGTLKAGEKAEFTFAVNVKSQEELAKYPNNTSIHNKASYKGKDSTITVIYKKPELTIDKSSDKKNVKNGDLVTYTVTIENKEDYQTIEQILEEMCIRDRRGSHENGDVFFQHREACNTAYNELPAIVEKYMGKINEKLGTDYDLFNYYGACLLYTSQYQRFRYCPSENRTGKS